jgi:predicted RNase H-like nuclease (RuvC/YqgF family)
MADSNTAREDEEEDLLYGDLEDAARSAEFEKLTRKVEELTKRNNQLQTELNETKQQLQVLVEEKAIVENNMMVLYNTALREIDRKDKQIAQLQRAGVLAAVSTPNTTSSYSSYYSTQKPTNT